MKITFDPAKRHATLLARGLDFADAPSVFTDREVTREDRRFDYGEDRFITVGLLRDEIVVVVWTPRSGGRRIVSMRHANAKERKLFEQLVR